MLAYVFWHWRRPDIPAADYERRQRGFHAALAQSPPPGFVASRSAAITGAPWTAGGGPAYEDWYLVNGSADLDPLNDAAVSGSRGAPHDAAAAAADGGTAGLYRLRAGEPVADPGAHTWFAKPAGMSYAALYEALEPLVRNTPAALWGRQMVLGPTPEFCLQSETPVRLPQRFGALTIALAPVWPLVPGGTT
jgi:hypothetical protein